MRYSDHFLKHLALIVMTWAGFLLASCHTAWAFGLRPAMSDVLLDPGASGRYSIFVTNDGNATQTLYLSVQSFIPQGNGGQPFFLSVNEPDGAPSWFSFPTSAINLAPGVSRTVPIYIRVPPKTPPGSYQAAVFFSNQAPNQPADKQITTAARTAVLFFVTVNGAFVEQAQLVSWHVVGAAAKNRAPVAFEARLANTGTVFLSPQGFVRIKNVFGQEVERLPFNPEQGRVLPNSARVYRVVWQDRPSAPGAGFWHEVRDEWRAHGFGPYHAELVLQGRSITPGVADTAFAVWPWHLGLAVLLAGVCAWLAYRSLLRRLR